MIQKRPIFTSKPIGLSLESVPFSSLCKHPLPFHVLTSVLLFYFDRKSKHFRNDICAMICVSDLQKAIICVLCSTSIFTCSRSKCKDTEFVLCDLLFCFLYGCGKY